MLNLTVKTKLKPLAALDKTYEHFTNKVGLRVVEMVGHMHAQQGFTEIRISSGTLSAKGKHEARQVLREILEHIRDRYGLETVHYLLHMHSVPDESVGHLIAKVSTGSPTEVEFTSEEYDEQVREFADRL
ncbi:MAG: hypothetical protein JSV89_04150 [Spirochaetaceae bacterium]|nr:MAG: hypothetical protein JSV89_04150 [Spirochaetaceae bacterium]